MTDKHIRFQFWTLGTCCVILAAMLCLSCYKGHGLSPVGEDASGSSGISGTITFIGEWPDSTREVRVYASKNYPQGITDLSALYAFVIIETEKRNIIEGDTIPRHVDQYDYSLNLKPDLYDWILVAWYPDIQDYRLGIKELGAYYDRSQDLPEPVYVRPGAFIDDIDIIADFSNIKREIPFFKQ